MDRDRRLTGYLRGQTDNPVAPAGFELNNPWRVCTISRYMARIILLTISNSLRSVSYRSSGVLVQLYICRMGKHKSNVDDTRTICHHHLRTHFLFLLCKSVFSKMACLPSSKLWGEKVLVPRSEGLATQAQATQ
jgi:hypothetical protein